MGNVWLTDLADAARKSGLRVIEESGWKGRGHGGMGGRPRGVLAHHMGTSSANGYKVVRDGRSDLPGPLAQFSLERNGDVRVLAAGCCWHAGTGGPWRDVPRNNGNDWLIGVEGCAVGSDWTPAQRDAYPRLVAALLKHYALPADKFTFHKLWAPGRKSDPGAWDWNDFARAVARAYGGSSAAPAPTPAPAPTRRLLDMPDRAFPAGNSSGRIVCPTGTASALVARSWLSVSVDGGARVQVWAQKGGGGDTATGAGDSKVAYRDWTLRRGDRAFFELPSGTEFVTYRIDNASGPGGVLIEQQAK